MATISDLVIRSRKAQALLNDMAASLASPPPKVTVILDLAQSASKTLSALLLLAEHKFEKDSLTMARSIFECALTGRYLRNHSLELPAYIEFGKVLKKKWVDWLRADPNRAFTLDTVVAAEADAEYKSVASLYERSPGRPRATWNAKTIRDMAVAVGWQDEYEGVYPITSAATHGSFMFVQNSADRTAPGEIGAALAIGFLYFLHCVDALNDEGHCGKDAAISGLLKSA